MDLTKDPVDPNGISEERGRELISQGYTKCSLKQDSYSNKVQFKDTNGNFYHKAGWLKAGTELYYKANNNGGGDIILARCSNLDSDWRTLSKIYC